MDVGTHTGPTFNAANVANDLKPLQERDDGGDGLADDLHIDALLV